MKKQVILALILLSILPVSGANATTGKAQKRPAQTGIKKGHINPQAKLGTSFKFDGTNLRGKYQSSLGTTATVENDKFLNDLLKGRTQFEDRRQQERNRN